MTWPTYRLNPAVLPKFDPLWKRRCLACRHLSAHGAEMRCARSKVINAGTRSDFQYCIDVRAVGGMCGPKAKEFFPKERP